MNRGKIAILYCSLYYAQIVITLLLAAIERIPKFKISLVYPLSLIIGLMFGLVPISVILSPSQLDYSKTDLANWVLLVIVFIFHISVSMVIALGLPTSIDNFFEHRASRVVRVKAGTLDTK